MTELGYAQTTAVFATASGQPVDVPGMSVTVDVGARPIKVILDGLFSQTVAGAYIGLTLLDGAVQIQSAYATAGVAGAFVPVHREVRLTPPAGPRTFRLQMCAAGLGQVWMHAAAAYPCFLQVVEL